MVPCQVHGEETTSNVTVNKGGGVGSLLFNVHQLLHVTVLSAFLFLTLILNNLHSFLKTILRH